MTRDARSARPPWQRALAVGVVAVLLGLPGVASAHRLSIRAADRAISRAAQAIAEGQGLARGWADKCERRSAHKVTCKAHTKGWVPSLGATVSCTRSAAALYLRPSSDKITVRISRTNTCKYIYPTPPAECSDDADNDGDGKIDYPADPDCTDPDDDNESAPLPAPETVITEGPAEGSSVEGNTFPDGSVIAFVTVGMSATGGVEPFFECRQDGGAFGFCGTGESWSTSLVFEGVGAHSFAVRACSGWGAGDSPVCDASPESRSFQVVASP